MGERCDTEMAKDFVGLAEGQETETRWEGMEGGSDSSLAAEEERWVRKSRGASGRGWSVLLPMSSL